MFESELSTTDLTIMVTSAQTWSAQTQARKRYINRIDKTRQDRSENHHLQTQLLTEIPSSHVHRRLLVRSRRDSLEIQPARKSEGSDSLPVGESKLLVRVRWHLSEMRQAVLVETC